LKLQVKRYHYNVSVRRGRLLNHPPNKYPDMQTLKEHLTSSRNIWEMLKTKNFHSRDYAESANV